MFTPSELLILRLAEVDIGEVWCCVAGLRNGRSYRGDAVFGDDITDVVAGLVNRDEPLLQPGQHGGSSFPWLLTDAGRAVLAEHPEQS